MECNKDEAAKAKELAEKKFSGKDILGAKKFAQKAHALFPELVGLPQLLATLDVHVSAEKKINGEVDCYGVLGVHPTADEDTLRKQYRRLALILHPDKNKSVGAEGAFKILSEVWSILSDKEKRALYDRKRFPKVLLPKVPVVNTSSSAARNGLHTTAKNSVNSSTQKSSRPPHPVPQPHRPPHPVPQHHTPDTFWTACTRCRMQYEYVKLYLNQMLMCPNCKVPFFAIEMPPPQMNGNNPRAPSNVKPQPSNHPDATTNSLNPGSGRGGASCSSSAAGSLQSQQKYARTNNQEARVRYNSEDAFKSGTNASKRGYGFVGSGSAAVSSDEKPSKKVHMSSQNFNEGGLNRANNTWKYGELNYGTDGGFPFGTKPWAVRREPSILEIRGVLVNKARIDILRHVDSWKHAACVPLTSQKQHGGLKKGANKSVVEKSSKTPVDNISNIENRDHVKDGTNGDDSLTSKPRKQDTYSASNAVTDSDTKSIESVDEIMNVPDADFFDFDKERSEDSFSDSQVWAAYDDDDKMPRFYAIIHKVISRKPFKMRISWLESKNTVEFGSRDWVNCGFQKTFGDFRVAKQETNDSVNSFSHKMSWSKGHKGLIRVYPTKGDVWALYRNWSPEWDEHTEDDVVHRYDMVLVLEELDEEKEVISVAPLIKVAGYKTVFRQQLDPEKVRRIPKAEMLCFSHQVPSHRLTGEESPNASKDCWELDPAALPMELLKVVSEDEEVTSCLSPVGKKSELADSTSTDQKKLKIKCEKLN